MPVTEPPPSRESVSDTEGMTVRVVVVFTNFFTLKEQNKGGRIQQLMFLSFCMYNLKRSPASVT